VTGNKRRWKLLVIHILPPRAFGPKQAVAKRAHHFIKVVLWRSKGKYRTPQHHARTYVCIWAEECRLQPWWSAKLTQQHPTQRVVREQKAWCCLLYVHGKLTIKPKA